MLNQFENELESNFSIEELFVSRTNKKGHIQSGNNVFVRISEFDKSDLLGRPHNVIRHPDMPKAVFKMLWNEISQDRVFGGYIKNKSKSGKYYWVFAVVFPYSEGYISVRMKPTSEILEKVKSIYETALQVEKTENIEASISIILQSLKELGFSQYSEFMHHALQAELFSRDEKMHLDLSHNYFSADKSSTHYYRLFNEISEILESVVSNFRQDSHHSLKLDQLQEFCQKINSSVSQVFSKSEYLSVNMSIAAHKLGKDGGTLGVVASTFQNTAEAVVKNFEEFQKISHSVLSDFKTAHFNLLSSRTMVEMLNFQIYEILKDLQEKKTDCRDEQNSCVKEVQIMNREILKLIRNNISFQKNYLEKMISLEKKSLVVKNLITRLDLIRAGGKLEGSRSVPVAEIFMPFVKEMQYFVQVVHQPIYQIADSLRVSIDLFSQFVTSMSLIEHSISDIDLMLEMTHQNQNEKAA